VGDAVGETIGDRDEATGDVVMSDLHTIYEKM
jgi:hypothetical protein